MTKKVASLCRQFELDMVVYEASAQQDDRAFYLAKELKMRKIGTKVIPLSYGGRNKEKIFLKVEAEISSGKLKLPILEIAYTDRAYNEVVEEFKIFRKIYTGTTIKFSAPEAKGLHDDFISSIANFIYLPWLAIEADQKFITANLSSDPNYDYQIKLYKNESLTNEENSGRTIFSYK